MSQSSTSEAKTVTDVITPNQLHLSYLTRSTKIAKIERERERELPASLSVNQIAGHALVVPQVKSPQQLH